MAERVVLYSVVALLVGLDWLATLRYLGIPWLFGQWAIVSINLLQHQDCDPGSELEHSRNVEPAELLGAMVEGSLDGLWLLTDAGMVRGANRVAGKLSGIRLEDAIGRSIRELDPRRAPNAPGADAPVAPRGFVGPVLR